MKKSFLILTLSAVSFALFGQMKPAWTNSSMRDANFPASVFFTGYTQGSPLRGESIDEATQRLSRDAQGLLVENIRVRVESATTSQMVSSQINQNEHLTSHFASNVQTTSAAEVVGMNTETFFDRENGVIHAFAHVNRFELMGFYRANLSMNLTQIEGLLNTAQTLETDGEVVRARQQLQAVEPLFEPVRYAQSLLITIDPNSNAENLRLPETERLLSTHAQMQARLAQGLLVYVNSRETMMDRNVNIVTNLVKAELAQRGCSFIQCPAHANFILVLNISTRYSSTTEHDLVFFFADAEIELFNTRLQRVVYRDQITQRGGGITQDRAARTAMTNLVPVITQRLKPWIEN